MEELGLELRSLGSQRPALSCSIEVVPRPRFQHLEGEGTETSPQQPRVCEPVNHRGDEAKCVRKPQEQKLLCPEHLRSQHTRHHMGPIQNAQEENDESPAEQEGGCTQRINTLEPK